MPERVEHLYCSQQIVIPPRFPHILKEFAKDAIRTQPYDLLPWAAAYFRCLAEGVPVPAKPRIEVPPTVVESGLTPGFILVLLKQFGKGAVIFREALWKRWMGVCLCEYELKKMLTIGRMLKGDTIPWMHFVALMAGYLNNTLSTTMIMLCELITEEPDGGSAMIPFWRFKDMYLFLAKLDCGGPQRFKGGRRILTRVNSCGDLQEYLESDVSSVTDSTSARSTESMQDQEKEQAFKSDKFYDGPSIESEILKSEDSAPLHDPKIVESDVTIDDASVEYADDVTMQPPMEDQGDTDEAEGKDEAEEEHEEEEHKGEPEDQQKAVEEDDIQADVVQDQEGYDEEDEGQDDDEGVSKDNLRKTSSKTHIFEKEMQPSFEHADDPSKILFMGNLPNVSATGPTSGQLIELDQFPMESEEEEEGEEMKTVEEEEAPICLPKYKGLKWKPREILHVQEIKGIGPTVPDMIIKEFLFYMQECSKAQHNMVMPRNMRHYLCPPMEAEVSASEGTFEDIGILY